MDEVDSAQSEYSDDETTTDEDIEPDNEEFEYDFLRALGALHQKDPETLKDKKFFKDDYKKQTKKEKKETPMTIKDYERHVITKRDGKYEDEEDFEPNTGETGDQEPTKFKLEENESEEESDGEDLFSSGLFKKKTEKEETKDAEDKTEKISSNALEYLKGNKSNIEKSDDKPLLDALKTAWNDPKMSQKDKWLADFFLNRRFMEKENESIEKAYNHAIIDEETLSEDEATVNKMEQFEVKYRFRFEEPDEEFIKSYPRVLTDTVRGKDSKRKEKREKAKKRKQEKMLEKQKELDEIKQEKKKQIKEKLKKIKEISGNDDIKLKAHELDEDFDPDAHDEKMSQWFGDDYYDGYADDCNEYPEMTEEERQLLEEDDFFNEDEEEAEGEEGNENGKTKGRKKSKKKKKDLYKLDFEDLVGGMICKYNYKKVIPNDFGLTTEQILAAEDKDLNRWCPMKKIIKYNRTNEDEKRDKFHYNQKAKDPEILEKFKTLFYRVDESLPWTEEEKKRKKNLKKKLKRQQKAKANAEAQANSEQQDETVAENDVDEVANSIEDNTQEMEDRNANIDESANSIENTQEMDDLNPNENNIDIEHKKKRKKKKKNKLNPNSNMEVVDNNNVQENGTVNGNANESNTESTNQEEHNKNKKRKKRKNKPQNIDSLSESPPKKKKKFDGETPLAGISDMRLEAYGQNPKKAKNKLKYTKCK